jgi:hypothetical protein
MSQQHHPEIQATRWTLLRFLIRNSRVRVQEQCEGLRDFIGAHLEGRTDSGYAPAITACAVSLCVRCPMPILPLAQRIVEVILFLIDTNEVFLIAEGLTAVRQLIGV